MVRIACCCFFKKRNDAQVLYWSDVNLFHAWYPDRTLVGCDVSKVRLRELPSLFFYLFGQWTKQYVNVSLRKALDPFANSFEYFLRLPLHFLRYIIRLCFIVNIVDLWSVLNGYYCIKWDKNSYRANYIKIVADLNNVDRRNSCENFVENVELNVDAKSVVAIITLMKKEMVCLQHQNLDTEKITYKTVCYIV